MRYPQVLHLHEVDALARAVSVKINGRYVPCRPMGFQSLWSRFRPAWLVFTGKADALVWPEGQ